MYDTVDKENCYKGEPTTNLAAGLGLTDLGAGLTYIGVEDGWKKYSMSGTWSGGGYPYSMALDGCTFTGGLPYSVKAILKTNVENKFNYFSTSGISYVNQPKDYEGDLSSTLNSDGSRTVTRTNFAYTSTTGQLGYLFTNPINGITFNPATDFVYLKDFQAEQKTHPTQFTPGTRSSTQGLLDLTNTNQIDLSQVSFDANAQINFDGTNDYINIGTNSSLAITGDMTICAWVYINNFSATYNSIIGKTTSGGFPAPYDYYTNINTGKLVFLRGNGSIYAYTTSIASPALNAWQFVAVTMSGITITHYLNGETNGVGTASTTIADNGDNALIGSRGDYVTKMNGKISTLQIYNRALNASEILQNYNATKSRFNLA